MHDVVARWRVDRLRSDAGDRSERSSPWSGRTGSDLHTVGGVHFGDDAEGVNSWSADGAWIYFAGRG